jgi:DNA helicase-4
MAVQIYKEYDACLRANDEIDFPDMINLAAEELSKKEDLYRDVFDHILVDEYQDLSAQRYKLLKTLMDKNPDCKLFGVGDDWQSIMGFAGSNLNYTFRFEDYFDHPAITYLSTNYRSNKSIVDLGARIIEHNRDAQLAKKTLAKNSIVRPIELYSSTIDKYSWEEYRRQVAEHCMNGIKRYLESGGHPREIMVLMRITRSPALINELFRCAREKGVRIVTRGEDPRAVRVMSVHQSKGLQAKTVFILNVIDHTYGFPCTLEDLDVLAPATDGNPRIKEEEERRLFYVAVTRAKENLEIYTQECRKSKFIEEIKEHLHEEKLSVSQTAAS